MWSIERYPGFEIHHRFKSYANPSIYRSLFLVYQPPCTQYFLFLIYSFILLYLFDTLQLAILRPLIFSYFFSFFFPHFIAYYLLYYLRPLFLSFFFLTPFPQAPRVGRRAFTTRRSSRCPTFSPLTAFSPFLSLYILDLANTKYERIRQRPPVLLRSYAFFSLK